VFCGGQQRRGAWTGTVPPGRVAGLSRGVAQRPV